VLAVVFHAVLIACCPCSFSCVIAPRFLAAGTIEEKIYQRQLSKEGLQTVVVEERQEKADISSEMLRWVFPIPFRMPRCLTV